MISRYAMMYRHKRLNVTVRWNEVDNAQLKYGTCDEKGNVFKPKVTLTDEQLADQLLSFPLPHPGEKQYEDLLKNALASSGIAI